MKRWNLQFGIMQEKAEIKFIHMHPNHKGLRLGDIDKRLGFFLTSTQAREWAKALTEAANALETEQLKP